MGAIRVITPAVTIDLTTLAKAKIECGVTDTSQDNQIQDYITRASSQIAAYCDKVFGLERVEERFFNQAFSRSIVLKYRPVSEIVSLTESDAEIGADEYYLDEEAGIIYRRNPVMFRLPTFGSDIVVTYDHGYELLDDLPHAIEHACLLLTKQYFFAQASDPSLRSEDIPGVASYSYGFGPTSQGDMLPPEVEALLKPFKEACVA